MPVSPTPDPDPQPIARGFEPARWLRNRHMQTIYASLPWVWPSRPLLRRESLSLPDGDSTAVDWLVAADELPAEAPVLVILHGLEGSARSPYARMLLEAAHAEGWRSCVLHFRDCGDYRNHLPRRYHAGETNDLRYFLNKLHDSKQCGPLLTVGFSLGGNVLLKYLGESAADTPVSAAAAVCVPLNLFECAEALSTGFSKTYQRFLLRRLKKAIRRKFDEHTAAFDWQRAMSARSFGEFDDAVTAPLHGFENMVDYYDKCSSGRFIGGIETPTLILNALDDPFMTPNVMTELSDLPDRVTVEITEHGGHVAFIDGGTPWRPSFYLPGRLTDYLRTEMQKTQA